jgi:iron complex transport system substrate-binding protein
MRRLWFLGIFLCVLALVAAGCGGDEPAADRSGDRGGDPSRERTVRHPLGTTRVPLDAERLVIVDPERVTLGYVLSLGRVPVAAMSDEPPGQEPFAGLGEEAERVERLPGPEPDLEAVARARPDLILFDPNTAGDVYDELSRIAPTVALEYSYRAFDDLRQVARALGDPRAAEEALRRVDEEIDRAREEVGGCPTISMTGVRDDGTLRLYEPGVYFHSIAAERLGCEVVPKFEEMGVEASFGIADLSAEETPAFDGEHLFLLQDLASRDERETLEELRARPLFQRLPAVRAGRVTVIDNEDVYGAGVEGWLRVLETMTEALSAGPRAG